MHRHIVFSIAAVAAIVATAACNPFHKTSNEIKVQDIPVGERWNATLATPSSLAGAVQIHGTGYIARDPSGSSKAVIHVSNATAGGVHPWTVRVGLCGTDNPVLRRSLGLSESPHRQGRDGAGRRTPLGSVSDQRQLFARGARITHEHGYRHRVRKPRSAHTVIVVAASKLLRRSLSHRTLRT